MTSLLHRTFFPSVDKDPHHAKFSHVCRTMSNIDRLETHVTRPPTLKLAISSPSVDTFGCCKVGELVFEAQRATYSLCFCVTRFWTKSKLERLFRDPHPQILFLSSLQEASGRRTTLLESHMLRLNAYLESYRWSSLEPPNST